MICLDLISDALPFGRLWNGHRAAKNLGLVNRVLVTLLASFVVGSVVGESTEPSTIRVATWNLEWFPSGSALEATPEVQAQRIAAAADLLRPINPDIILLQEVRDYEACVRLDEAIAPGMYHVAICSAFKEPFQSGLSLVWLHMAMHLAHRIALRKNRKRLEWRLRCRKTDVAGWRSCESSSGVAIDVQQSWIVPQSRFL
jgi:hypothetical protein